MDTKLKIGMVLGALALCGAKVEVRTSNQWTFSALFGQRLWVSKDASTADYRVKINDVTVITESCEDSRFQVCFLSGSLNVAIPKDPPEVGSKWEVDWTHFEVERIVDEIEILGRSLRNVYLIRVRSRRDVDENGRERYLREERLYFSYLDGLIGFDELGSGEGSAFITSDLPSLGATRDVVE